MRQEETELCRLTIRQAGDLIRKKELSPVELVRAHLERIERLDGKLKSYVRLSPETALSEARAAEAEVLRGEYRGPLHGIPVAHKDQFDAEGMPSGARPDVTDENPPPEAAALRKLRDAGTVLLGKLEMDGLAVGENKESQRNKARNPWNLAYSPGGSSSGSGAGVSAGLCMGSLGEDTAGSIRIPAAYCGLVGLKPTFGLVSKGGLAPLSWSLDQGGPITRTAEDNALLLQGAAGYDPTEPTSPNVTLPDYAAALTGDVRGLVVGVPRHYIETDDAKVEPETMSAMEKALSDLESLGARVEEVRVPSLEGAAMTNIVVWYSEAFANCKADLATRPHIFGDTLRGLLELGGLFTASDYILAQRDRRRIRREMAEVFQRVDVLALPTTCEPAMPVDDDAPGTSVEGVLENIYYLGPFNISGNPGVSIPSGFNRAGMPLSFQLVGKAFGEGRVLQVADAYLTQAGWCERRPPI